MACLRWYQIAARSGSGLLRLLAYFLHLIQNQKNLHRKYGL